MSLFDKTIYECALCSIDNNAEYNNKLTPEENIKIAIQKGNYSFEVFPFLIERANLIDFKKYKELLTGYEIPTYIVTTQRKNGASETTEFIYPNMSSFVYVANDTVNSNGIEVASLESITEYRNDHKDIDVYKRQLEVIVESSIARFIPDKEQAKVLKNFKK